MQAPAGLPARGREVRLAVGDGGSIVPLAMRIVTIINPISGASKAAGGLRALFGRLRAALFRVEQQVTTGPGSARSLAQQAVAEGVDAVLAVGGDGTVCEVADGLAGSQVPLAVWPQGTENLVAKSLGFRADAESAARCLTQARKVSLDIGLANGRAFLVVAGVGFDAEVVYRLTRMRSGHITHLTYFWPLWRTFWEHRWPMLHVTGDTVAGRLDWSGRGMVFVGNMARYSLGLPVVRDARPDDGLLDLCIMECRGVVRLLGHAARTVAASHVEHPAVQYTRVTRVRVASGESVPVEIDGDFAGWLPVELSVRPACLWVLDPAVGP